MITITHEQYAADILKLVKYVKESGCESIYGIPRGGQYPAAMLAQATGIRLIFNPCEIGCKTIIVDDLIDTGDTVRKVCAQNPKSDMIVVYKKASAPDICKWGVEVADDWIVFPDESGAGIEDNLKRVLEYIGEDTTREGLIETPKRMRRAYDEIFSGYKTNPNDLIKTFTQGTCQEMVILKNAEFYSTCEHHFFPFFGHCSIGYIPSDKVIGVSKLARLLDCFSKRMQIQERMTSQIADFLVEKLNPRGVYVVCEGVHFCMTSRGVKKQDASMITSAVRGVFQENAQARNEFLHLIGK